MARRIIITIIALLTIGAAINVLIAWSCVSITRQRMFNARRLGQLRAAQFEAESRLPVRIVMPSQDVYLASLFESCGTRILLEDDSIGNTAVHRIIHDAGWPMLSLRAEQVRNVSGGRRNLWGVRMGGLDLDFPTLPTFVATATMPVPSTTAVASTPVSSRQKADRLLPLRPLWPGFAINTLAYALAAWLLWTIFATTMRLQRRLRDRCGYCAYPIGSSPVCTECGRKVRARLPGC